MGIAAGLDCPSHLIIFPYMPTVLSHRLGSARRARGLTQASLGRAAGVPHAMMISGWERGVNLPRVDYLTAVARVLGVSLDWLCGLTERGGPKIRAKGVEAVNPRPTNTSLILWAAKVPESAR